MSEFRFAFLPAFLLLVPALFALGRYWLGQSRRLPPVLRYSDTRILAGLPSGMRVRLRRLPDVLRIITWLLLMIALARPQYGTGEEILRGKGIDIVLVLDISDSMAQTDFNGMSRFDAAKEVMRDFVEGRYSDRIGLVVFAEDAYYQAPPTTDYNLLLTLLDEVPLAGDQNLVSRTAVGMGIASATNMLRYSDAPSRVLILLTDGASNAGEIDAISAAQAADAFGMRIYTIGIGSLEADSSALDETTLRQIASISSGRYFNANNLEGLQNVYEQIDRLERAPVERQLDIQWQDQAWGFMIAALICLILERLMRHSIFQSIP